jgi:hypothetical protein
MQSPQPQRRRVQWREGVARQKPGLWGREGHAPAQSRERLDTQNIELQPSPQRRGVQWEEGVARQSLGLKVGARGAHQQRRERWGTQSPEIHPSPDLRRAPKTDPRRWSAHEPLDPPGWEGSHVDPFGDFRSAKRPHITPDPTREQRIGEEEYLADNIADFNGLNETEFSPGYLGSHDNPPGYFGSHDHPPGYLGSHDNPGLRKQDRGGDPWLRQESSTLQPEASRPEWWVAHHTGAVGSAKFDNRSMGYFNGNAHGHNQGMPAPNSPAAFRRQNNLRAGSNVAHVGLPPPFAPSGMRAANPGVSRAQRFDVMDGSLWACDNFPAATGRSDPQQRDDEGWMSGMHRLEMQRGNTHGDRESGSLKPTVDLNSRAPIAAPLRGPTSRWRGPNGRTQRSDVETAPAQWGAGGTRMNSYLGEELVDFDLELEVEGEGDASPLYQISNMPSVPQTAPHSRQMPPGLIRPAITIIIMKYKLLHPFSKVLPHQAASSPVYPTSRSFEAHVFSSRRNTNYLPDMTHQTSHLL